MTNYALYYKELDLEDGVGEEEIKRAYKKLALKYHPDKNQGDSEATNKFLTIGEAYEKLTKHLRGEESDDEEQFSEKEAELEMLIRELARERKKEKRRREQERWEEEFKMEQMKKRLQREREEREEEFQFKVDQIKKERQARDESLRKRTNRAFSLERAATTANLNVFTPHYSSSYNSYSSYTTDMISPTYSSSLTSKWLAENQDENSGTNVETNTGRSNKVAEKVETEATVGSGSPGPYSWRRKYKSGNSSLADDTDTASHASATNHFTGTANLLGASEYLNRSRSSPGSASSTPRHSYANVFTSAEHLARSAEHSPSTEFSSDHVPFPEHSVPHIPFSEYRAPRIPFAEHRVPDETHRSPDYWTRRSSSVHPKTESFPNPTSTYSRSIEDLTSGGSETTSGDTEDFPDNWGHSLPKRKSTRASDRLKEQIEWEKQFFRDTERRRKKREEEERHEEERLRLELQNQQIKMNQNLRHKQQWEERFAHFPRSYQDELDYYSFIASRHTTEQQTAGATENE